MNDCSKWYINIIVYGLRAEDASGSDFIVKFTGLVKYEHEDVLIVGYSDDRLKHKLPVPYHRCTSSTVISVLPTNTTVLLMNTDDIWHVHWFTFVRQQIVREIVYRTKTITT